MTEPNNEQTPSEEQLTDEQQEQLNALNAEMQADILALGGIPLGLVVEYVYEDGKTEREPYSGWGLAVRAQQLPDPTTKLAVRVPKLDDQNPARAVYLDRNRIYRVLNNALFSAEEHFGTMVSRMIPPGVSQAGLLGIAIVAVYDKASEPNGDGVLMHAQTAPKPLLIHHGAEPLKLMLDRIKEIEERIRGQLTEIYGMQVQKAPELVIARR